jgi:uncharacterized membrane protein YhaH (DUF805 family)
MISEDVSGPSLGLGLKAWRDSFRFRGRSTRSEIFSFWVVSIPANILLGIVLHLFDLSLDLHHALDSALPETILIWTLEALPFFPMFALIARRAQDFGWPGWPFTLLMIATCALGTWDSLQYQTADIAPPPDWVGYARTIAAPILIFAMFWVPTRGPNRFGPDSRLDAEPAPETVIAA